MNATYSPEDNKLRLYSEERLDSETYAKVKAAGFRWAPQQKLFVAPAWTPGRESLLLDLCGEVGDEDTSLAARAEERAERFEDYSEKRAGDAEAARQRVEQITDGIPLGQPILVGHHSERRARKHAQQIENGMRKAVNLWRTSQYWQDRAAGALRLAKYKERPEVRARRIKGIEADRRKQERRTADAAKVLDLWNKLEDEKFPVQRKTEAGPVPLTIQERAEFITNHFDHTSFCFLVAEYPRKEGQSTYEGERSLWSSLTDGIITPQQARDLAVPVHIRTIDTAARWMQHYDNRLAYEKTMLAEQGASELIEKRPPRKSAKTQLPLCNYRAPEGINIENTYHRGEFSVYPQIEMTKAEYTKIGSDYKGTESVSGSHRVRVAMVRIAGKVSRCSVFLTDSKVHPIPEPAAPAQQETHAPRMVQRGPARSYQPPERTAFDDMQDTLRSGGVRTVVAGQLFPTPHSVAVRLVELAGLSPYHRVLEPSAGTGNLLKAIGQGPDKVAVEINQQVAHSLLSAGLSGLRVVVADFLECAPEELGVFDRVIMNPPFKNGLDIQHIRHAQTFLKPGGRLVAGCANGPRQQAAFRDAGAYWENLPAGSFREQGTNVNTAIIILEG